MLYVPKKSKYKKQYKGKIFNRIGKNKSFRFLTLGSLSLIALTNGKISSTQLNSINQTLKKKIKKLGKIYLNIFPQTPITKKPNEVRMGKGKGNVNYWVYKIKPGEIVCKIETDFLKVSLKSLLIAKQKLPIKTKIIFN